MIRAAWIAGVAAGVVLALGVVFYAVTSVSPTLALTDVEEVEIHVTGSCGLRSVHIDYQGETWAFDLPNDGDYFTPTRNWGAAEPFQGVVRVGRNGDEVWAVGPDGSPWRLMRADGAALLFCLW